MMQMMMMNLRQDDKEKEEQRKQEEKENEERREALRRAELDMQRQQLELHTLSLCAVNSSSSSDCVDHPSPMFSFCRHIS